MFLKVMNMLLMFLRVVINLSHTNSITHHTKSLLRAAQSGSEGGTVLFFHIPPSSVTHFFLPLHNQSTSFLAVQCNLGCVVWSFPVSVIYITLIRSMQAIAWSIQYCLKTTSQTNDYLCLYRARTCTRLESRNALNLSLYSYVESVSKLGSRRKPVCG